MASFYIKTEKDLFVALKTAESQYPKEPISLNFETKIYNFKETIILPRAFHGLVHINGNGSHINFSKNSLGFISVPKNNSEALNIFMGTRYLIENFSKIQGGVRGIHIGGTFNTIIRNIQFIGQKEAGIEIQFGLMTRLENILVTNTDIDGIRLGIGTWDGATKGNSQSNHSVLDQCRIYNKEGSRYSFNIQHSSGIVLDNCIAEGRTNLRGINFNAYANAVVKNFTINNFHLEYSPSEAGIWISASARTSNIIDKLYISSNGIKNPIVTEMNAPIQIRNISWWKSEWKILSTHHAPRILIDHCNWQLNINSIETSSKTSLYKNYITIINQLSS